MNLVDSETEVVTREIDFLLVEVGVGPRGPKGDKGDPGEGASPGSVRVDASVPSRLYRGTAPLGTLESAPAWTIAKIEILSGHSVVVSHAVGVHSWDDRNSLDYL